MSDMLENGFKAGGVPALEADGSNFVEWMDLVKTVLLSKGLWDYAAGDILKPSTRDAAKEFDKEDAKAAAYLKIAAGKQQWPHLLGLISSKDVLDKLTTVRQGSLEERLPVLQTQFYRFKALATIDLSASKLTQLQLEIATVDQSEMPSDATKKMILLHSLPEGYRSTVCALKAAGLSKIGFDDIVQRLKETEVSINGDTLSEDDLDLARMARGSGYARKGGKDKRDAECFYCHKKGHFKRDCWALNGKPDKQQQLQGATEHVAAAWGARYQAAFTYQKAVGQPERQSWCWIQDAPVI